MNNDIIFTILLGFFIGAALGSIGGYLACGCIDLKNILKGTIIFGFIGVGIAVAANFSKPL